MFARMTSGCGISHKPTKRVKLSQHKTVQRFRIYHKESFLKIKKTLINRVKRVCVFKYLAQATLNCVSDY